MSLSEIIQELIPQAGSLQKVNSRKQGQSALFNTTHQPAPTKGVALCYHFYIALTSDAPGTSPATSKSLTGINRVPPSHLPYLQDIPEARESTCSDDGEELYISSFNEE